MAVLFHLHTYPHAPFYFILKQIHASFVPAVEQLIAEATLPLTPALILLFPAVRNSGLWVSLAFSLSHSSSTCHFLSVTLGLFVHLIFPIEPSVPWKQDLRLIYPKFINIGWIKGKMDKDDFPRTKIQIQIKIEPHPALRIKETDISLLCELVWFLFIDLKYRPEISSKWLYNL